MIKIAQRYLAVNFIVPFWVSLVFFVSFLLISQLFRIVRIVVNKSVELSVVAELISYIAISFIPMASPLAIFFSTMYALNKLSGDSEIIALRSFGYTKRQLFAPFIIFAGAIGLSILALNQNLIPKSQGQFDFILSRLTHKGLLAQIEPEKFFTGIPGVILFSEKVKNKGMKLEKVFIKLPAKRKGESVIFADEGVLIKQHGGEDTLPSVRLHLMNGNITTIKPGGGNVDKLIFDEYDFPIFGGKDEYYKRKSDRMRTTKQLQQRINERRDAGQFDKKLRKSEIEFWSRFNIFLQCIVFVLLGFSFGIKKGRGARKNVEGVGLLLIVSYYVLYFFGIGLTKNGIIPAYISVFAPSFIMTIVGIHFFRKLDWVS